MLFNAFQVDKHILQVTNISLAQLAAHCCPPAGAVVSSRHAPLIPPWHHASPWQRPWPQLLSRRFLPVGTPLVCFLPPVMPPWASWWTRPEKLYMLYSDWNHQLGCSFLDKISSSNRGSSQWHYITLAAFSLRNVHCALSWAHGKHYHLS